MLSAALSTARIADFSPGGGVAAGASAREFDDTSWLDVRLPADVHTALVDAGRLVEPYADAGESEVAWVARREWWYRCPIPAPEAAPAPDERVRLILHGLDTEAEIWVNGVPVGAHHSMFRPAEFDVTDLLDVGGDNVLAIRFAPIVGDEDVSDVSVRDTLRVRRRKMQVGFGWDISCYLLTVGVWQPIEVRRERVARLGPLSFATVDLDPDGDRAVVKIGARVDAFAADPARLRVHYRLTGPDGTLAGEGPLTGEGRSAGEGPLAPSAYLVVDRPALWWTHDLGQPDLYRLTVSLTGVDGEVVDVRESRVGIRTIALDQSPDQHEPGSRFFRFVLNGQPIYARGANWVPDDLRIARVEPRTYRERLAQAAAANMNMIRIWGGGIYEKDAFYEACDELGLLIWHDFMFACLAYPDDPEFLAECEAEARYQVARLQARPSLALWCGNNEAQGAGDSLALFAEVLPRAVAEEDGRTPYWPGSPYGGNGYASTYDGDTHDWRGFHGTHSAPFGAEGWQDPSGPGRHWHQYAEDVGRFVSEFGFAAPSTLATIEHWNSPAHRDPRAHAWQDRIRYVQGDAHMPLLETITGVPRDAREWVDYIQLIQAEGLRFGIERFRERKPHCSGALLWQLNDCWPGFTWSIVDFDGRPKPAYYAVRRAFSPVLATVKPMRGGAFELWLINDSGSRVDDVITLQVMRLDGTVLRQEEFPACAEPHAEARLLRRFGWGRVIQPRSCYVSISSARGTVPASRQLFADFRQLELPEAELTVARRGVAPGVVELDITASAFVPMVAVEHPHLDLAYDDNYFALDPGVTRTVRVRHAGDRLDPAELSVRALYT
ncbi:glycoside hydrolase family 2 protein [Planosporangium thailandense]|uniref:beta-mannosidase n=1 Tax=Planosporangium thailandense TaxID=765197 RepID=A0ABX0Y2V7_9ACTN|nr:glycoside hydrolase family 2 protein [Planosporangium thailandense]NJC72673.1 glycoside hydrolase family 2 protein [Planosporangium thailandense]